MGQKLLVYVFLLTCRQRFSPKFSMSVVGFFSLGENEDAINNIREVICNFFSDLQVLPEAILTFIHCQWSEMENDETDMYLINC